MLCFNLERHFHKQLTEQRSTQFCKSNCFVSILTQVQLGVLPDDLPPPDRVHVLHLRAHPPRPLALRRACAKRPQRLQRAAAGADQRGLAEEKGEQLIDYYANFTDGFTNGFTVERTKKTRVIFRQRSQNRARTINFNSVSKIDQD